MFGSLMVMISDARSPSASATAAQYRANRRAVCGSSHPPARTIQRGLVKWCSVTTASIPCAAQHAAIER